MLLNFAGNTKPVILIYDFDVTAGAVQLEFDRSIGLMLREIDGVRKQTRKDDIKQFFTPSQRTASSTGKLAALPIRRGIVSHGRSIR